MAVAILLLLLQTTIHLNSFNDLQKSDHHEHGAEHVSASWGGENEPHLFRSSAAAAITAKFKGLKS